MCQIKANPMIAEKNAITKPIGVFLGTAIGA
jgi:hypothetical protein